MGAGRANLDFVSALHGDVPIVPAPCTAGTAGTADAEASIARRCLPTWRERDLLQLRLHLLDVLPDRLWNDWEVLVQRAAGGR